MGSLSAGQADARISSRTRIDPAVGTASVSASRPHPGQVVPLLRQYVRLVSWGQARDVPLAAIVGQVVGAAAELGPADHPRMAVFRAFHALLDTGALDGRSGGALRPAYSCARMAMLLADVMSFHAGDIGTILKIPAPDVPAAIEAGRDEVADLPPVATLIAEDESWIAADLEMIATDLGLDIRGVTATRAGMIDLARRTEPGLVIADACLAGSADGLESALGLREVIRCPIIYVTALADRLSSLAHLDDAIVVAKPYRVATLRAAIGHVLTP